jgi:hypothetical protein
MDPDTVQVIVRVVEEGVITCRFPTGPGPVDEFSIFISHIVIQIPNVVLYECSALTVAMIKGL